MSSSDSNAAQLGFDALLADAETESRARRFERDTAHLPDTMEMALPFYRDLIDRYDDAVMAADVHEAKRLAEEAHNLALRVNGGEPGILAHDDAPGYVLARETAAPQGTVPLWGQEGQFVIHVDGMRVRIELDGLFGICTPQFFWPGFSAHAVDWLAPFLSPTGYRSFLGIHADPQPNLLPDEFTGKVITRYVRGELKGKLVDIGRDYCERALSRAEE